jgi:hypothetical protein
MRPVWIAATLAAAVTLSAGDALAQKPRRAPAPAPAPTAQDPEQSPPAPRDVAVPREAVAPRVTPKSAPRTESTRGEATPLTPPSNTASSDNEPRSGAVGRPPSDAANAAKRDHAVSRVGPPPRDYDDDDDYYRHGRVYYYPSYYSHYYDPYYYPGFYLGYLAYSPWGWTPAFYGYPYGYGYGGTYSAPAYDIGKVRIKVRHRDAEVFVDGYYAGTVDDFDGMFQSLQLESGGHRIEIMKPGFETLVFDVHVQPDRTVTYRGDLRPVP